MNQFKPNSNGPRSPIVSARNSPAGQKPSDENDSFVSDNYARAQSSTRVLRGDPG